ncbi:MAG: hypothetical protein LBE12_17360 [Planctomycetaceae bacterium]|nr:hypothetical protein [Planctomycetaceae bacterium]
MLCQRRLSRRKIFVRKKTRILHNGQRNGIVSNGIVSNGIVSNGIADFLYSSFYVSSIRCFVRTTFVVTF